MEDPHQLYFRNHEDQLKHFEELYKEKQAEDLKNILASDNIAPRYTSNNIHALELKLDELGKVLCINENAKKKLFEIWDRKNKTPIQILAENPKPIFPNYYMLNAADSTTVTFDEPQPIELLLEHEGLEIEDPEESFLVTQATLYYVKEFNYYQIVSGSHVLIPKGFGEIGSDKRRVDYHFALKRLFTQLRSIARNDALAETSKPLNFDSAQKQWRESALFHFDDNKDLWLNTYLPERLKSYFERTSKTSLRLIALGSVLVFTMLLVGLAFIIFERRQPSPDHVQHMTTISEAANLSDKLALANEMVKIDNSIDKVRLIENGLKYDVTKAHSNSTEYVYVTTYKAELYETFDMIFYGLVVFGLGFVFHSLMNILAQHHNKHGDTMRKDFGKKGRSDENQSPKLKVI